MEPLMDAITLLKHDHDVVEASGCAEFCVTGN
jgi:hypothetical protein